MRLLHFISALALCACSSVMAQPAYPDRPIKMIVPLAAASAVDVAARIVTQKMADNMGQQIVILNQPGASGLIGAEQVARADPDGYTIGGFNDSIMTMVPNLQYKGATQAATDVAAGQIPVGFQGLGTVAPLVRGGQLRLIGVTTQTRLPQFSDVPTVSESGLPGFFFNSWFAMLAPAGTPKEIVARLNAEVVKAIGDADVRRKLEELGFAVRGSSPEELGAMTRDQLAKYARVIKEMGIANE